MNTKLVSILSLILSAPVCVGCSEDENFIPQGGEITVNAYKVVADGITDNTIALQAALDECSKQHATLIVPAGTYLTGPLFLKSNTTLKLEQGAVIKGVDNMDVYAAAFYPAIHGSSPNLGVFTPALLYAGSASNITITGEGTLDGSGESPNFPHENNATRRPKVIFMVDCQNVTVENIKLRNSAFWTAHFLQCDSVTLRNLDIYGHANWNNDGLDIDSKNVLVENCTIDVDDDAVCLKSDLASVCENIRVKNCVIKSNCNAIKFGTSSYGGFKNVDISNCSISKASEDNHRHWQTAHAWAYVGQPIAAISGIAVESVDGGILEDVTISDITMADVMTPIFIRLGDRHRTYYQGNISVLKNVTIRDITATGVSRLASSITAVEGTYAENVTIKNINITVPGGGTLANISELISENIANYPEATMFGKVLPAYGFYLRHIKNITFDNITVNKITSDVRPLFYCDDVDNATLTGSRPADLTDNEFLRQKNCNNITVNGVLYEGGVIGGSGGDPNEGTLIVGENTYTTYNYNGTVWMVTNSKEGTPTATTYTGHTAGENGYYYNSTDKLTACPCGWHLPTIAEALALQAIVRSDVTADNVKWWKQALYGANAGRNSGTLPNGSWGQWGTTGIWRLGSGKVSNPDDETHVFSTLTNYPDSDVDPNHDPVTHFIVEESVNDTQSNRARWFSVRCVQD